MFVCFYVYIIPACESEAVEDLIRRTNNLNERFKKYKIEKNVGQEMRRTKKEGRER